MIHKSQIAALSAVLCLAFTCEGYAQSSTQPLGFGTATTQNLIRQNSASRFSSSNIQQSLLNRSTTSIGVAGVNQKNYLNPSILSTAPRSKPFSSVTRGPTVSPYLALSAPRASASDYYNVIRPQQQQQADNRRQQILAQQQNRRLNQLAARAPFSTTGDENSAPTGHVAVFQSLGSYQNTGGYFPPPSPPKQR